ncbi:uncharacterized protein LOC112503472 [Cynara cardunculus var. scolymus]|uniref:uncharacterized protein LOC112503472 n=1 Tax=Cynara cardunculus var. scolymus TaxID=59895 RepID=UPI000D62D55A|nr:uncharacterized protein LOC112503472 [Cynara cardunculus var. scolymus]
MGRGVRQGDPLAPFLFILASEGLNVIMREAQRKHLFKGVKWANQAEEVSILQYADDAIFIGEWAADNAKNLLRILKCFEVCSGLKINLSKSRLTGVAVSKEEISRMACWLKCKEDAIPFHYLGLPVGGNRLALDPNPSKANIHLWRTLNNRLATRDDLMKRGVACSSDECPTCLVTMENLNDVFVNCSTAQVINAHMVFLGKLVAGKCDFGSGHVVGGPRDWS